MGLITCVTGMILLIGTGAYANSIKSCNTYACQSQCDCGPFDGTNAHCPVYSGCSCSCTGFTAKLEDKIEKASSLVQQELVDYCSYQCCAYNYPHHNGVSHCTCSSSADVCVKQLTGVPVKSCLAISSNTSCYTTSEFNYVDKSNVTEHLQVQ